jgi:hypothetical protein
MAAGLGYKEFTTGDVLTAADANGYLASQVVMVFADAAARTSAIASPEEGMISFLKDTNSTEYYSGAAWVAVGGSTFTGLKLISTTPFTSVAAQSIPSVFSATYTNYRILINISACTATSTLTLRLRSGATDNSTGGNYLYQNLQLGGITNNDAIGQGWSNTTATSFVASALVTSAGFQNRYSVIEMLSPFETFKTGYTAEFMAGNAAPHDYANKLIGRMDVTTSYDGFSIIAGSGNITGKVSVYGYNV